MQAVILTIGLSFFEGVALIASPCILPILPIILAGSLAGSKRRPFGIIVGFVLFFTLFTLFSRKLVEYSGIDLNLIRHVSYAILILLGIIMLSTYLTDKFNQLTQRLLNVGANLSIANDTQSGFLGGVLFGGLVAVIWTPCAGPILAAVVVQTVIQQTNFISFLTLLSFGIGVAVPMLIIATYGRVIINKLGYLKNHTGLLRKTLGLILILSVAYLINLEFGTPNIATKNIEVGTASSLINPLPNPYPAPAIEGISKWINSSPLTIADLKGKVVLIDFWTYSCINCIRTLPYIKGWYDKYHDKGLVIIGIHAPEFEFEKDVANVQSAVTKWGIKYPIALDNNFITWRNYSNRYWPAHYLINKNGEVVYTHFGEGEYDTTENNIRYLLGLDQMISNKSTQEKAPSFQQTPETYLGYQRIDNFSDESEIEEDKVASYKIPTQLDVDHWALEGRWKITPDKIIAAGNNVSISIHFRAKYVYAVMGNQTDRPISVTILLNNGNSRTITVDKHALYDVVSLDSPQEGVLKITSSTAGLELYTFTFGS